MPRFNPFPPVHSRYGAPMGRTSDPTAAVAECPTLFARHQGGGQGYDRGGAYWGLPSDVWAVWGHVKGDLRITYVRAADRQHALDKVKGA